MEASVMGEVEEMHSKEETVAEKVILNGDITSTVEKGVEAETMVLDDTEEEHETPMEVDDSETEEQGVEIKNNASSDNIDENSVNSVTESKDSVDEFKGSSIDESKDSIDDSSKKEDDGGLTKGSGGESENEEWEIHQIEDNSENEVQEIDDDDELDEVTQVVDDDEEVKDVDEDDEVKEVDENGKDSDDDVQEIDGIDSGDGDEDSQGLDDESRDTASNARNDETSNDNKDYGACKTVDESSKDVDDTSKDVDDTSKDVDDTSKDKDCDDLSRDGDVSSKNDELSKDEKLMTGNSKRKKDVEMKKLDDSNNDESGSDVAMKGSSEGDEVTIIEDKDTPKENGKMHTIDDDDDVIAVDTPVKKLKDPIVTPRRSSRNLNKVKSYSEEEEKKIVAEQSISSEESDIEEILPQDPLADLADKPSITVKKARASSTIVVKDTKRLVEIAAKSNPNSSGKKEPTLVIIDTNSILSGRGPVPLSTKSASQYTPVLPAALPAQGIYPANMRATITPIPLNSQMTITPSLTVTQTNKSSNSTTITKTQQSLSQAQILPSLTDDMFVVEAPSFIVPYVYEKPPVKDLKDFVKTMADEIREMIKKQEEEEKKNGKKKDRKDSDYSASDSDDSDDEKEKAKKKQEDEDDDVIITDKTGEETEKTKSYFDSPLGKFFVDIGYNLVQEFVQTDLLKQQKRKRDREGGHNSTTNKTIQSLLKNLEYSKENNEPFKMDIKKCEFCSFKTESALAMAFHLETPHMKNYVYRCNFCPLEVRSPHDILFHMEAEHMVRGRLERAPAFHQCPNCPFEDNQKGKLSRHAVACARKFKPERNMDPPIDWEPPAKIPRVTRMKQQGLTSAAALYMNKTPQQYQMMSKLPTTVNPALNRGRGRPSLGTVGKPIVRQSPGMVYKPTMSGGSVLVPTNYQLSGNQLYQQTNQSKKPMHQPSISITPLPRGASTPPTSASSKPGDSNSKSSFVICEICDGYIKDLEQLRNHMQWIHKVKIHPKMIYNRPPLNCQKCQFRFFTDQGLERHLLGSHGLVTSSMQEAANKSKDSGRCPVCGRVYQWKLLNHVARDHNMTLKPAHLSYKCTVCTATFGMYKQFENHVYSAHSVVAKRVMDKKSNSPATSKNDSLLKPLKINDEITIIPQVPKSSLASTSKEGSPSSTTIGLSRNSLNGPSTSKMRR